MQEKVKHHTIGYHNARNAWKHLYFLKISVLKCFFITSAWAIFFSMGLSIQYFTWNDSLKMKTKDHFYKCETGYWFVNPNVDILLKYSPFFNHSMWLLKIVCGVFCKSTRVSKSSVNFIVIAHILCVVCSHHSSKYSLPVRQ